MKGSSERVQEGIFAAMRVLLAAAVCLILFLLVLDGIFGFVYPWKTTARGENFGLLVLACGALVLLAVRWKKLCAPRFSAAVWIASAAAFVVQIALISMLYAYARGDAGAVSEFARRIAFGEAPGEYLDYFSEHGNNLFLAQVEIAVIGVCKWLGIGNWRFALILLGCLLTSVGGVLFAHTARRIGKDDGAALLFYGIYLAVVVLSPRNSVPYSDVYGLLFPVLTLFLFTLPAAGWKKRIALGGAGLSAAIGAAIKPTVGILAIAIVLVEIVLLCTAGEKRERGIGLACFAIGCLIGFGAVSLLALALPYALDGEKAIGLWHYLMMGANEGTSGTYSAEDVAYSQSFASAAERAAANRARFAERVGEMGFFRYLALLGRKLLCTFGDGAFGWAYECEFTTGIPDTNRLGYFLRRLLRAEGDLYPIYAVVSQLLWLFVLLCCVGWFFRKSSEADGVIALSLAGLVLYQLLFEAGARYLFLFQPLFLLAAASGFAGWRRLLTERRTPKAGQKRGRE